MRTSKFAEGVVREPVGDWCETGQRSKLKIISEPQTEIGQ
jgi:hypothetical protein